jgi:hypothetical protein
VKTSRRAALLAFPLLLATLALAPSAQAQTAPSPTAPGSAPDGVVLSHPVRDNSALRIPAARPHAADAAPAASKYLKYTQQIQKYDEWCWAADGSSIEQYYGSAITQDQFCAAAKGTAVGNCPNETGELNQIVNGFQQTGFQARETGGALSWSSVQQQVNAGMPAMTVIAWASGGAHAETIYGYDANNGTLSAGDPWYSYSRYWTSTYNNYLSNSTFTWTDTVADIRKG